MENYIGY
ncbi:uncharacterized protein FTOL_13916 [Fusarium torulosum]|nr:uncharacterized protein FTOL_13916 [Fusarium torulosum]